MKFGKFINDEEVQNDLFCFFANLDAYDNEDFPCDIQVKDNALMIYIHNDGLNYEYIIKYDKATSPKSFLCIYRYPEIDDYLELIGINEISKSVPIEKLSLKTIKNVFDKMWNTQFN